MTEPIRSAFTARNREHAGEQISLWIKECRQGLGDREAGALQLAALWQFDEEPIREGFVEAREFRAKRAPPIVAQPIGVVPHRRRLAVAARPDDREAMNAALAQAKKISPPLQSADDHNATVEANPEVADQPAVAAVLFAKELPVPSDGPPILSRNVPMDAARKFCDRFCWINGALAMYSYQGDFYRWNGSHYAKIDQGAVLGEIYAFLDGARVRENGGDVKYVLRARDANEILECLRNGIILPSRLEEPYWLNRKVPAPTVITFKNKIYDYATGKFQEPTLNLWVTDSIDIQFDANATAPRFDRFLKEIFPGGPEDGPDGDVESQQCILEQLGYGMTNETKFDKAALWYGVLRSGKSTLARIQHKLVGDRSFVAIDLHNLNKTENSAQLLIGKKVAVAGDVRMRPSKWYGNNYDPGGLDYKVAQLILKVTGRDDISLGRKYKDAWEGRLTTKFIIITNDVPNFGDVANVLPTRFIKIHFKESFEGREDNDLQDVAA
jgi:putative DNA primase/helicase